MKAKGWIVTMVVVGGLGIGLQSRAGCANQPEADQRFGGHLESLCEIARANIETPEKGVRKLGAYLAKNLGGMTGSFGATIATIERIPDDAKHDARARLARDRIHGPLIACQGDWIRFGEAVEANPKAKAMIDHAALRLNRTFDILLGKRDFSLRDLPARLESALPF